MPQCLTNLSSAFIGSYVSIDDRLSALDALQCPFLAHFYPLSYVMHSYGR